MPSRTYSCAPVLIHAQIYKLRFTPKEIVGIATEHVYFTSKNEKYLAVFEEKKIIDNLKAFVMRHWKALATGIPKR